MDRSSVNPEFQSWGRFPAANHEVATISDRFQTGLPSGPGTLLPYGAGRSYGDSCLNDGGTILSTRYLDHLIAFDQATGVLRAEAGVTLETIIDFAAPRGWFPQTVPGTKFVTLGGAIANDIHGKNHHRVGTFGKHVLQFELLRSDGSRTVCSPASNAELYSATIAGLGLTGLITWAEIQLKPIKSRAVDVESIKFNHIDEFFELSAESDATFEYTVAWVDCLSTGKHLGRGVFLRGNHAAATAASKSKRPLNLTVPFDFPQWVLNPLTIRAFNTCYFHKQLAPRRRMQQGFDPFFFPLDAVRHWNRIYGTRGLIQFQLVVPKAERTKIFREILAQVAASGSSSFLTTVKEFGSIPSPGMLSFPREGTTVCLDFANNGAPTLELLLSINRLVELAGGAVYPAKDTCMDQKSFERYYPRAQEFSRHIDPKFSSSFWRRVCAAPGSR